jgi:predicted small lipoprotein YifL
MNNADAGLRDRGLLLALLLAAVLALYWPALGGGFAFDDYPNIVMNRALHVKTLVVRDWLAATFSSPAAELPRPLSMLSFGANHYFTGLQPWPMKLTNLLVHLANTLLLYCLLERIVAVACATCRARGQAAALFGTACWSLMPINLMPVLLIVQRMESLANLFVFAGLLGYIVLRVRRDNPWTAIGAACGFTLLGLCAKESAALLPLYCFLLECFVLRFRSTAGVPDRRLYPAFVLVLLLPALAAVAWLLPRSMAPGAYGIRDYGLVERLLTEPHVLFDYLRWTLLPSPGQFGLYHDDYPVTRSLLASPVSLFSMLLLAGMAAASVWLARRRPIAGLGLAWFLAGHLLTATFIPLELVFEHRNYFASAGMCLVLLDLLVLMPKSPLGQRVGLVCAIACVAGYAAVTHARVQDWTNPFVFARGEALRHPQSPRATYSYAQALALASDGKAGSPITLAAFGAFEHAMKVPGAGIAPAQGALLLAARTNSPVPSQWWLQMQSRLRSRPASPQDLASLASLTNCSIEGPCRFPPAQMVATFLSALEQRDDAEVMSVYGNYAYNVLRDKELAERLWRQALRLRPDQPEYHVTLIKMLIRQGRSAEARREIGRLRGMGRFGQYQKVAADLEVRAASALGQQRASGTH